MSDRIFTSNLCLYGLTVCYDALCKLAQKTCDSGPFDLIETLGERIAHEILAQFAAIRTVRVTLHKPSAPIAAALDHVGIEILRQR